MFQVLLQTLTSIFSGNSLAQMCCRTIFNENERDVEREY